MDKMYCECCGRVLEIEERFLKYSLQTGRKLVSFWGKCPIYNFWNQDHTYMWLRDQED